LQGTSACKRTSPSVRLGSIARLGSASRTGQTECVQKSCRLCEKSATQKALSEFRGLRSRRAEKITKIRSPRDYGEFPIEFSHGLLDFCTHAASSLLVRDQFQREIEGWGELPNALGVALSSLLRSRLRVSMTFARAGVDSPLGFPALLHWLGAEVPSFRFADESANRARAASAFRRAAQRRIDVANAPGAIQRCYGRPNSDVRQHVTRTNDHPWLPGDGGPHRGFLYNPSLNKGLRYKGFGGYLVERAPLRQWGQAHFRMNARNRRPRSASTFLQSPESRITRPGRRLRIQRPPLGSPLRRASGQHRSHSRAALIEAGEGKLTP
jgi:hypothetical protein